MNHRSLRRTIVLFAVAVTAGTAACALPEDHEAEARPHDSARGGESPAAAVTQATTCRAEERGPAPTNVPVSAIQRYARTGIAPAKGPYKPVLETDPGLPDYTVYRPEPLGAVKHPVLVWGNGGCVRDGTYFSKFLLEVASHGFVVVADGRPNGTGSRGLAPDGRPLIAALDWILKENDRPCSQYYQKLAANKAAVAGQSCGGLMALGASSDRRLGTVIIFNSGLFQRDQAIYRGLHAPMAYFIGGPSDVAYPQAEADTKAIDTVPLFYGNLDVGHFATWGQDNAGEFGRIGVHWLKWRLMDDAESAKVFSGPSCELCTPPSKWKVVKKNME